MSEIAMQFVGREYRRHIRRPLGDAPAALHRRVTSLLERRSDLAYTLPVVDVEKDSGLRCWFVTAYWYEAPLPVGSGRWVVGFPKSIVPPEQFILHDPITPGNFAHEVMMG